MTLGISIGSRLCGTAVLSNGELMDWRTHTLRNPRTQRKAELICRSVREYIELYDITDISIKIPPHRTHSAGITMLIDKLLEVFQHHDCMVQVHTKSTILKAVPEVRQSKDLMCYVTAKYSMLMPEQINELTNRRPYHHKMFEAVLVAHLRETI